METVTPAFRRSLSLPSPRRPTAAAPITLDAESSLSLPVSLSVISGPGTLDGDVLTITGAGTIVVRPRSRAIVLPQQPRRSISPSRSLRRL